MSRVVIGEGAPGIRQLHRFRDSFKADVRPLVVVPSIAARNQAEGVLLTFGVLPEVVTSWQLARLILRLVAPANVLLTHDLISHTDRRQLLIDLVSARADVLPSLRNDVLLGDHDTINSILRAIDTARLHSAGEEEIFVHATAAGHDDWREVAPVVGTWDSWLAAHHVVDRIGLLTRAMFSIREVAETTAFWERFPLIAVIDPERYEPPVQRIITSLLGSLTSADSSPSSERCLFLLGDTVSLRMPPQLSVVRTSETNSSTEVEVSLVTPSHPGLEPEAIIGAAVRAADQGTAWHDIAIVSPNSSEPLRAITRSAQRANIPVQGVPAPKLEGPLVDQVLAVADRCRDAGTLPSRLAEFVELLLPVLRPILVGTDQQSADIAIGLLRDAQEQRRLTPDAWCARLTMHPVAPLPDSPALADAVWMGSIEALIDSGMTPSVVILRGATEGSFPAKQPAVERFAPEILGFVVTRDDHIDRERRRFNSLRQLPGLEKLICVAAPEPGVLLSRFVEPFTSTQPTYAPRQVDPERWPNLATTVNPRPLVTSPGLKLSATQITMFENCSWQYTLQYRLNLPNTGGLAARFGSYVHEVLEKFVDLENQTLEDLLQLAYTCWDGSVPDYLCQEDDYLGRAITSLTAWYERAGKDLVQTKSVLKVEHHFSVAVGPHTVSGFIDRIDLLTDTDGSQVLGIVDYKTARTSKSEEETATDIQLAIYHLAASRDPELLAYGPVQSLSLDFLVADKLRSMPITEGLEAQTEARMLEVADLIHSEVAEPNVLADCGFCDLHRVCSLQLQGRPVPVALRGSGNKK